MQLTKVSPVTGLPLSTTAELLAVCNEAANVILEEQDLVLVCPAFAISKVSGNLIRLLALECGQL